MWDDNTVVIESPVQAGLTDSLWSDSISTTKSYSLVFQEYHIMTYWYTLVWLQLPMPHEVAALVSPSNPPGRFILCQYCHQGGLVLRTKFEIIK